MKVRRGLENFAAQVVEEDPWESAKCELRAPPDMARLVFAVPLHTNEGDDIQMLFSRFISPEGP